MSMWKRYMPSWRKVEVMLVGCLLGRFYAIYNIWVCFSGLFFHMVLWIVPFTMCFHLYYHCHFQFWFSILLILDLECRLAEQCNCGWCSLGKEIAVAGPKSWWNLWAFQIAILSDCAFWNIWKHWRTKAGMFNAIKFLIWLLMFLIR